jgi:hypothetical protein
VGGLWETRNNVKSKLKYWKPTESYIVGLQLHVYVLEKKHLFKWLNLLHFQLE